jgi:hypothetical protein
VRQRLTFDPDAPRIWHAPVSGDDLLFFQQLYTPQARRRGWPDDVHQILIADASVLFKAFQNALVDPVDHHIEDSFGKS